jgi:hypothetical protein
VSRNVRVKQPIDGLFTLYSSFKARAKSISDKICRESCCQKGSFWGAQKHPLKPKRSLKPELSNCNKPTNYESSRPNNRRITRLKNCLLLDRAFLRQTGQCGSFLVSRLSSHRWRHGRQNWSCLQASMWFRRLGSCNGS